MIRYPLPVVFGAALLLPAGCAKGPPGSPTTGTSLTGKLLTVSLTVRGQIDPTNSYYFVVFNVNNTSRNGFTGPVPVVTDFERGGNGFAGGSFSHFVEIHQGQPVQSASGGNNFGIYSVDPTLLTPTVQGAPIQAQITTTQSPNDTLRFEIPLSALATNDVSVSDISTLQVNFITTNIVPTNPQDTTPKYFDAIGDPRQGQLNDFISISTAQDTTYTNTALGYAATDHVATYSTNTGTSQTNYDSSVQVVPDQTQTQPVNIPNLNIVSWSITFSG
ncbi:MAG: hypothetical protein JO250_14655 [Armatimonadetes bacterium]|nr:hypothetical protein [Armatimonadota bacterium]